MTEDYTRLKAERIFLGEREPLPDGVGSEPWMAVSERNLRRLKLDTLLMQMETARLVETTHERDGW